MGYLPGSMDEKFNPYMEALVDAGLRDKEMSADFEQYLRTRLS